MGFDKDQALYNRNNRTKSPDFAPGMDPNQASNPFGSADASNSFGSTDASNPFGSADASNPFGSADAGASNPFGSADASNPFGSADASNPSGITGSGMGMSSAFGGVPGVVGQQNTQQAVSPEDKFWGVVGKIFTSLRDTIIDVCSSFSKNDVKFYNGYLLKLAIASGVLGVLNFIALLFGFKGGLMAIIGCLVLGGVSFVGFMFTVESASDFHDSPEIPEEPVQDPFPVAEPADVADDFDIFANEDDSDGDLSEPEDWFSSKPAPAMNIEDAIKSCPDIPKGMYTRRFLYDQFVKVLPRYTPNFTKTVEYGEEDEFFLQFDDLLSQASELVGLKTDDYPVLTGVSKTLFGVRLTMTRNAKIKPEDLAREVSVGYAHTIYSNEEDCAKVFYRTQTVLKELIITIFTGEQYTLSVGDIYDKESAFMLDTKKRLPAAFGINEVGKPYMLDLSKIESIIIAGMPRSGKTWTAKSVLLQLCALASPKELNLIFLDPKADSGDWARFKLPHVKRFASKYTASNGSIQNPESVSIMDTLRWVVNKEAPRRKKLLGDNDCVNINDFHDKCPDVDLPYLYVVIDEMVTLSQMEKEEEKEYQGYLDQLVTQFPNLGIKGFFIPHEVKNQIISKTAYDSIKARISVLGSASHIEQTTGAKPAQFKYRLVNQGDMAVSISQISGDTVFAKSCILCDSNEQLDRIGDYLRRMWSKWEPDSVDDSVCGSGGQVNQSELEARVKELEEEPVKEPDFSQLDIEAKNAFDDIFS